MPLLLLSLPRVPPFLLHLHSLHLLLLTDFAAITLSTQLGAAAAAYTSVSAVRASAFAVILLHLHSLPRLLPLQPLRCQHH